jgi:hypothetical protein
VTRRLLIPSPSFHTPPLHPTHRPLGAPPNYEPPISNLISLPCTSSIMSMSASEHAQAAPVAIPEPSGHSDQAISELVAAFESYDFRNDQEFRVCPAGADGLRRRRC